MTKIDKPEAEDRLAVPDDEKKRVIDFWDTNLPVPTPGIFDEPTRCYRINTEWAKVVMGFASWLAEIAAWKDAQDENYPAIQEILKFLKGDSCVNFMLRQNPEDPCLFEQSLDGGETWSLAYDYSLCAQIGYQAALTVATNQQNLSNAQETLGEALENFNENYAGDISELYPELEYGGALDGYREEALCYALRIFINMICEKTIEAKEDAAATADEAKLALYLAAATLGVLAIATAGSSLLLAGALGATASALGFTNAFGSLLFEHWTNTQIEQYQDEMAKEEVLCHVFEQLSGSQVEQSELAAAFASFAGSANGGAIATACALFAAETAGYVAFILAYRDGLQISQLGLTDDCACMGGFSMLEHVFTLDEQFFTAVVGQYVDQQYFDGIETDPDADNLSIWNCTINRQWNGAPLKVVGGGIHYDALQDCGITSLGLSFKYQGNNSGGFALSPLPNGTDAKRTWGVGQVSQAFLADEVTVHVLARRCNGQPAQAKIKAVRIWLAADSEVRGRPEDTAPIGTGANGTTDVQWWQ